MAAQASMVLLSGYPGSGVSSSGMPGGGIVMVTAGNITGTGTINASGLYTKFPVGK